MNRIIRRRPFHRKARLPEAEAVYVARSVVGSPAYRHTNKPSATGCHIQVKQDITCSL